MSWVSIIDHSSKKFLARIPKEDATRIINSIGQTVLDPYSGDLQKMKETVEIGKTYPFQVVVFQPDHHKLSLTFLGKEQEPIQPVTEEKKE